MIVTNTVLQWNLKSYRRRFQDLKILLQQTTPACVCLQETLINYEAKPPTSYNIVRSAPTQQQGHERGVAILIHKRVAYQNLPINTTLQATAVKVHLNKTYTICSIYLPHMPITKRELQQLIRQLPSPFLLLGDMNAKSNTWGEAGPDGYGHGRIIDELLLEEDIALLNYNIPTHYSVQHNTVSLIDLSMCSTDCLMEFDLEVMQDLNGSDHYPIQVKVKDPVTIADAPDRYDIKKADWNMFKLLTITNVKAHEAANVDELIGTIEAQIVSAAAASMPLKSGIRAKPPVPWFNREVALARKERIRAQRAVRRNPTIANKIAYSRLKAKCKYIQLQAQRTSWKEYITSINSQVSRHQIWKRVNKIAGKFSATPTPVLRTRNGIVRSHREVAAVLAENFAAVSEDHNYPVQFRQHKEHIERRNLPFNEPSAGNEVYNMRFTIAELQDALKATKESSPGQDQISYSMMKSLHDTMMKLLLDAFNRIYIEQQFPTTWKTTIVTPIAKPNKDPSNPKNYRPIALSSCMCKLLEKMVNARLMWYLERGGYINGKQAGFRKNRSATDALIQFEGEVQTAIANKQHTIAIFFDINKAYDTAWRRGVMEELYRSGLRGALPMFVANFLSDRRIRVRIGSTLSDPQRVPEGIPQGSVLSCTCFMLAINSITENLPEYVNTTLYVDDFCIYTSGQLQRAVERKLQIALSRLATWSNRTGFTFSTTKTFSMHICRRNRCPRLAHQFTINNTPIRYADTIKFLGMTIDGRLNWKEHISNLKRSCLKSLNILRCIAHKRWGADRATLIRLYMMLVKPKIDYGSEAYSSATAAVLDRITPVHNAAIRTAVGAFRSSPLLSLYAESGVKPLSTYREVKMLNTYLRILANPTHPLHETAAEYEEMEEEDEWEPSSKGYLERVKILRRTVDIPTGDLLREVESPNPQWNIAGVNRCSDLFEIKKKDLQPVTFRRLFQQHSQIHRYTSRIYTDGSKTNDGVGFAYYHQQSTAHTIPEHASAYTAELYAIYYCLNFIHGLPPAPVTICTDSRSAILAINSVYPRNPLVMLIKNRIHNLGREITFCWVPSHVGVTENERADEAARAVIGRQDITAVALPRSDIKVAIKRRITERWRLRWEAVTGNKYREVTDCIKPLPNALCSDRQWEVVLARLRIGHTTITHRYLMERGHAPYCQDCVVPLTVVHLLVECPSYADKRIQLFGQGPHRIGEILGGGLTTLYGPLYQYLKQIGIYNNI